MAFWGSGVDVSVFGWLFCKIVVEQKSIPLLVVFVSGVTLASLMRRLLSFQEPQERSVTECNLPFLFSYFHTTG